MAAMFSSSSTTAKVHTYYNVHPQSSGSTDDVIQAQPESIGLSQQHGQSTVAVASADGISCPRGLEYLMAIDQLLVHQKVELLEAVTGFETQNQYEVKNSIGQKIYHAKEVSSCCSRICCGSFRAFDMKIIDSHGEEVIHLYRPLACSTCWFPCCLQTIEVTAPPGTLIGSIHQDWTLCNPHYSVKDAAGQTVLIIKGPFCTFSCCGRDVKFNIFSVDGGTKIGKISKQWSGLVREAFTDADMFGINFPIDLDVKMKAVLLGACFLIDFMFFESSANKKPKRPGMF